MTGRNHALLGGTATAVAISTYRAYNATPNLNLFVGALVVGIVAALLPDMDNHENHLRSSLGLGSRQTKRYIRIWEQNPLLIPANLIRWLLARILDIFPTLFAHRGVTHWVLTAAVLTLILRRVVAIQAWSTLWWIAFGVGYTSHLIGDSLTKLGIPALSPIINKHMHLLPRALCVRTGQKSETIVVLTLTCGLLALAIWIWVSYPPLA